MKKIILLAAVLASTSVFAKGSDNTWTCKVKAKSNGQTVRYTLTGLNGGLGSAFHTAIRDCKQSGYTSCRANCFSN